MAAITLKRDTFSLVSENVKYKKCCYNTAGYYNGITLELPLFNLKQKWEQKLTFSYCQEKLVMTTEICRKFPHICDETKSCQLVLQLKL